MPDGAKNQAAEPDRVRAASVFQGRSGPGSGGDLVPAIASTARRVSARVSRSGPETDYLTFGDYMWIGALISIFSITIGRLAALQPETTPIRARIEFFATALAIGIYFGVVLVAAVLSLKFIEAGAHGSPGQSGALDGAPILPK